MVFGHGAWDDYVSYASEDGGNYTQAEIISDYEDCKITYQEAYERLTDLDIHWQAISGLLDVERDCDIEGCMDPTANNYDEEATIDDGSCEHEEDDEEIEGCMDPTANNYDEEATIDDGSCEYEDTMFSDFEDWQLALGAVVLVLLLK